MKNRNLKKELDQPDVFDHIEPQTSLRFRRITTPSFIGRTISFHPFPVGLPAIKKTRARTSLSSHHQSFEGLSRPAMWLNIGVDVLFATNLYLGNRRAEVDESLDWKRVANQTEYLTNLEVSKASNTMSYPSVAQSHPLTGLGASQRWHMAYIRYVTSPPYSTTTITAPLQSVACTCSSGMGHQLPVAKGR